MYLLKLNLALIVLFGFYKLMFSGDTFFALRRATLIGMCLVTVTAGRTMAAYSFAIDTIPTLLFIQ